MRIATAGRGEASGKICIWDLESVKKIVLDGGSFEKYAQNAKLSELEEHSGCVNCVRWSKNGQLLASGGDDCNVIVWGLKKMKTFTNDKALKNREMWKSLHNLQGHTGDILDVAWSNCQKFLASCSIDNLILIWDVNNLPSNTLAECGCVEHRFSIDMIRKLVGHQSFVKGLAWDPVGEFLASQSDDRTLMIWSTLNFVGDNATIVAPTAVVKKPFKKATSLTQFLRLAWSSDGQYIVSAHAANNTAPVAKIIERGSWTSNKDCVGHRAAVSSVAFNPNIYKKDASASDEDINVVCALGSRDGTLSLWVNDTNLIVSNDRNSAGNMLLLSCVEGNLSFIVFDPEKDFAEYPLNPSEITNYHKKHYGLNVNTAYQIPSIPINADFLENNGHRNGVRKRVAFEMGAAHSRIENSPIVVDDEPPLKAAKTHTISAESCPVVDFNETVVVAKQKETILKDGRKRITPILIAAPIEDSPSKVGESDSVTNVPPKKPKRKSVRFEDNESPPEPNYQSGSMTGPMDQSKVSHSTFGASSYSKSVIGVFSRRSTWNSVAKVKTPPIPNIHEFTVHIDEALFTILIKNESQNLKCKAYELLCSKNNQPCWSCFLAEKVVVVKHCENMFVCTTEDNRLHVFNYSGWRIFPQIIISDTVIGLFVSSQRYISVVTTFGEIMTWDVTTQKLLHNHIYIPMDHVKDNSFGCLKSVDIHTETEQPVITLDDYTTYLYNDQLAAWLPLTDKMCVFSGCFPSLATGLASIIDQASFSNVKKYFEANSEANKDCTDYSSVVGCVSFLLNQMDVFITLKLKQPFYDTFIILIQFLTEKSQIQMISSLCEHLSNTGANKNTVIFNSIGLSATFLLEKLLSTIKKNIAMQQVYLKFQPLLEE